MSMFPSTCPIFRALPVRLVRLRNRHPYITASVVPHHTVTFAVAQEALTNSSPPCPSNTFPALHPPPSPPSPTSHLTFKPCLNTASFGNTPFWPISSIRPNPFACAWSELSSEMEMVRIPPTSGPWGFASGGTAAAAAVPGAGVGRRPGARTGDGLVRLLLSVPVG